MMPMTKPAVMAMVSALLLTPVVVQAQQPEPAGPAASAPATTSAKKTTLESADFTTKATGQIELVVGRDSPIHADFQGSPALTLRLREALQARGFELAQDASSSRATLQFRGDIVLMGGPKFHKGVKASIGEATEKALKLVKESGQVRPVLSAPIEEHELLGREVQQEAPRREGTQTDDTFVDYLRRITGADLQAPLVVDQAIHWAQINGAQLHARCHERLHHEGVAGSVTHLPLLSA